MGTNRWRFAWAWSIGAVLGITLVFQGCASLSGSQPVKVLCVSCEVLQESGLCAGSVLRKGMPYCVEPGHQLWVVNYRDVVEHGAPPKVECR